jgi:hypothetical protein
MQLLLLAMLRSGTPSIEALSAKEQAHVTQLSRPAMCNAVIDEMHGEILKHDLKKDGEDDVYETVPAICLGVVQNYTYELVDGTSNWGLVHKVRLHVVQTNH